MATRSPLIGTLQSGRGLAAIAVLMFHAVDTARIAAAVPAPVLALGDLGNLGVDYFFVLSGFIIYRVHGGDAPTLAAASRFAARRLERVYLPYLPVAALVILAYLALPGLGSGRDWGWLTSLTLLPSGHESALAVAWTLVHEVAFYAIFAAAFYAGRPRAGLALWVAAIVLSGIAGDFGVGALPLIGPFATTLTAPINLEFVFGLTVAALADRLPARLWPLLIAAGVAGMAGFAVAGFGLEWRVLFGFFAALTLAGLVAGESRGAIAASRLGLFMGAASYAIYLVHQPAISVAVRVLAALGIDNAMAVIAGAALAAVAAGILFHLAVEKPLLAVARALLRRRRTAGAEVAAAA